MVTPNGECCAQCGFPLPPRALPGACPQCALRGALVREMATASPIEADQDRRVSDRPDPVSPRLGAVWASGDYELLEEIARGGMGVVYRARQRSLNRIVAVKMILSGRFAGKQEILRFRAEAEAAARLRHPNIVAIYETGERDGHHYFSMDYVAGRNLAEIARDGPVAAHRAARYVRLVAEAIHYAHQQGTLHRDLKPSNILIDGADQPRVTDFGLAKRLHGDFGLTVTGQTLGSPNFMPPEQTGASQARVGAPSDVYGLGAILYHLLTGRPPFQAESLAEVLRQLRDDEPVSPRLLNPGVPRDLETICARCLEKEPSKRYPSAQALAEELERLLKGEPILSRPVSGIERVWRWCRRKPAVALLAATISVLLAALAIGAPIAAFRIDRERRHAEDSLYAADVPQAQAAWERGNLGRARELLELHRPRPGQTDRRGFEWRYLAALCEGSQIHTWRGHSNLVSCVAFSPDGGKLASGSWDATVRIRDVASRKDLGSWVAHRGQVVAVAFSSDGRTLATAGTDDTVRLWNVDTGQQTAVTNLQAARLAFSPVGTLLAIGQGHPVFPGLGGEVSLWDYANPDRSRTLSNAGSRLAFSADGSKLVTGSRDGRIKLWDIRADLPPLTFSEDEDVVALACSPNQRWLASSTFDGADITLWEVETGRTRVLSGHTQMVWSLAFSPDGMRLASASADQSIRLWDVATGQARTLLRGHGGEVLSAVFAPDGRTLASGSRDQTVRLWSVDADRAGEPAADYQGGSAASAFSPDGRRLFTGTTNHAIEVWEIASHRRLAVLTPAEIPLAASADNRRLIALGPGFSIQHWDLTKPEVQRSIPLVASSADLIRCGTSRDGGLFAACHEDGAVGIWKTSTGQRVATWIAHPEHIFSVAFSPDARLLATCSRDTTAKLWDVATGRLRVTLTRHNGAVFQAIFLAEGAMVATVSSDGTAKLWAASTGELKATLAAHEGAVEAIALSPDGRTLATGSHDRTVRLWSWATQREMLTLHNPEIIGFTGFSPDGTTLAAGNRFGYLRLWHVP